MKSNTLFRRFIILSIISFLITGTLLAIFVYRSIISQETDHNIEIVSLTLGHSLEHWFEDVDLNALSDEDIEHLDVEFHSLHALGNIADIRIWNLNAELLYSHDKNLIKSLTTNPTHFDKAISLKKDYTIVDSSHKIVQSLDHSGDEFIAVYLPIYDHNDTTLLGVFEVYRVFDHSRDIINQNTLAVLAILFAGLILLYLFLAKVIHSSSGKVVRQAQALKVSYTQLSNLYRSMIRAITNAIDARDEFTSGHSQRVSEYAVAFSKYLGHEKDVIDHLEIAALLHDIGKLGIPESIIKKNDKLTQSEYEIIRQHPAIGVKIIKDIDELSNVVDVIQYHHEQYSGIGYPASLKGEAIPYEARLVTIIDAYDAMTSERPYRKAMTSDQAIEELKSCSGSQFDPELTDQFIAFLNEANKLET